MASELQRTASLVEKPILDQTHRCSIPTVDVSTFIPFTAAIACSCTYLHLLCFPPLFSPYQWFFCGHRSTCNTIMTNFFYTAVCACTNIFMTTHPAASVGAQNCILSPVTTTTSPSKPPCTKLPITSVLLQAPKPVGS